MTSPSNSRFIPTPHQVYLRLVKNLTSHQTLQKDQLKKQIQSKYQKHMSLLQSHQKKQLRFEKSFEKLLKHEEQRNSQMQMAFKQKERKIRESRDNILGQRRKRIEGEMGLWKYKVEENMRKYEGKLDDSKQQIKKWNQKCEESINKKRQRLNTISSNLSQRSRVSSAKTRRHQQQQLQRLLQRALVNPQKTPTHKQSRMFATQSRVTSSSRVTTQQANSRIQSAQKQRFDKYLSKIVLKQRHIAEVRNKKTELIHKARKQRQEKEQMLEQLHRQNNCQLESRRQERDESLDNKFAEDRRKINKSLPYITNKPTISGITFSEVNPQNQRKKGKSMAQLVNSSRKDHTNTTNLHSRTLEPKLDKMIMDELRNLSVVARMRQGQSFGARK